MAKETIYRSDYSGQELDYDFDQEPQPYKITIQAPGVAATKAESFTEVYLSEDDYRHLVASLRGYYEDEEGNKKKAGPINRGVAEVKQTAPNTRRVTAGSNAPAKDGILLEVLAKAGIDKQQVGEHVKAQGYNWGGKRFSVDTLKQVIRDKNLTSEAKEAGVPVNA